MRRVKRLGWVILATVVIAGLPGTSQAQTKKAKAAPVESDSDLEARVRALEKKVDTEQKSDAAESKTVSDRIASIEKSVTDVEKTLADKLGLNIHGFVAGSYNYNTNNPDSEVNNLRVFDTDTNTFTLDQANLMFSRKKEDENLGFVINVDFGKVAEVVGSVTHWSHNPNNTESNNSVELREAYMTYKIPVGDGLTLKAGKFSTLLGAEIIENFDNHNFNVSRSFSFGYGIPFTHTGLLASFPVGDVVAFDLGIVNGWDDVVDQNDGKTALAGITLNLGDMVSAYISGTYGPEQANNGHSNRGVTTAVVTVKPVDMVTLVVEGTYGNETDLVGPTQNDSADWYGTAGYVVVKPNDDWSFALRGEIFCDPDGVRTLVAQSGFNPGVTLWEVTPTVTYQVSEGLMVRAEYRHDESDREAFQHESHPANGQDTIATQLIYSF